MTSSTRIIAEAGVNHNGSLEMAFELVDVAAASGADYIKFQSFRADDLASKYAKKASYQVRTTANDETQFEMLKRLELSPNDQQAIIDRCNAKGVQFLSTPFDLGSLKLLTERFGLTEIKIGSGELTNAPLLFAAGRADVKIILSTGMGSLAEVEEALGVLAFAMCRTGDPQSRTDFAEALLDPVVWGTLAERVILMQCTTEYPAQIQHTNLNAMKTMRQAFGLEVGYSDHTKGHAISLAAVALRASVLEKHFTLDKDLPGPDHAASLNPKELKSLVRDIRAVELALGTGIKQPSASEVENRTAVRKSLVAGCDIREGQKWTRANIVTKRPGDGVSPMNYWNFLDSKSIHSIKKDDQLKN